jgi:flagellin-like hook-associated protein FlgL
MQLSEIYQQRMALDIRSKNPLATSDEIAIYNKQSQMLYERILQIKEAKFDGARLFSTDHNLMTTNVDTSLINGAAETISQFNLFTQNDPKPVEMIFLMDYSGSMQTTIDNVRNNVASFVSAIQTRLNASTWQAKAVAYRGLSGPNRHDFFAPNGGNFVSSTGALQSQLGQITASGGGTPGETLIDGINDALNIGGGWQYSNSKKVLMAFTDEPSDPIRTPGLTLTDVTNRLNQDDVNFWLFSDYPNGQAGYDSLTPQLISQSGANTNTLANANSNMSAAINSIVDSLITTDLVDHDTILKYLSENNAKQETIRHLQNTAEIYGANVNSALGRIQDVDVAQESITKTRYDILHNFGISMLAQANQSTSTILNLLT